MKKSFFSWKFILIIYIFISGFLFSFLIPPFQKADEFAHFKKTVYISNFILQCNKKEAEIPKIFFDVLNDKHINSMPFNYGYKFPISLYKDKIINFDNFKYEKIKVDQWCSLPWTGYITQTIVYSFLKYIPLNGYLLFNSMRFFIFLINFILILFFIIKIKNDHFKNIFYFTLSLPMTIHQLSSFSYDGMQIVFAFIFLILIFNTWNRKKINFFYLIFLSFIFLIFLSIKPGYEFFIFLILTLPYKKIDFKSNFINRNKKIFFLVYFLLILIFIFIGKFSLAQNAIGDNISRYNSSTQFQLIIKYHEFFINALINTYEKLFEFYIKNLIGIFGWLDYGLSFYVYLIYFILFGYFIHKNLRINITKTQFIFLLVSFFTTVIFIFFSFHLSWSNVGSILIEGVQGRYFIVLVPLLFLILIYLIKNLKTYFLIFLFFTLIYSFSLSIYNRYFNYSVLAKTEKNLDEITTPEWIRLESKSKKLISKKISKNNCYSLFIRIKNVTLLNPLVIEIKTNNVKNPFNIKNIYILSDSNNSNWIEVDFKKKIKIDKNTEINIINDYTNPVYFDKNIIFKCLN